MGEKVAAGVLLYRGLPFMGSSPQQNGQPRG
jgi:hypothetical protein